jgi:iron(III) transport system substrate-binding protein
MKRLPRRTILKGMAAAPVVMAGRGAWATTGVPTMPSEIDIDKAKAEGKVQLYTSLDTKIVDAIIGPFKEKYGISVEYFRGGSADVTSKVLAEADAGRIQADIVDASDLAALLVMKDRGLLLEKASEADSAVSADLRDPDGTWMADRLTQAVIQFSTAEFGGEKSPKSWTDLTAPAMSGRLTFFSSANGDGAPRLYTLAKHLGWELLEKLAANDPLRVASPQLVTQILESGERGAAFATNDNIAWRSKLEGKPTDYLYPAEGVPTEPGAVGLVRDSANPHAAFLFHEFWMGKEAQTLLVGGGKYSSRVDVDPPTGSTPLGDIKLLTLDYAEYKRERQNILQRMTDVFGGEWGV